MKKRNKAILLVLPLSMSLFVGCAKESNKEVNNENTKVEEKINKNSETNKNLEKFYDEKFEAVKSLFEKNNIKFEEINEEKGYTSLYYYSVDEHKAGEFSFADYYRSIDEEMDQYSIVKASLSLTVDTSKEFKIEETPLYELSKIIMDKEVDYTETNKQINEKLNKELDTISNTYDDGKFEEYIRIENNLIEYSITVRP